MNAALTEPVIYIHIQYSHVVLDRFVNVRIGSQQNMCTCGTCGTFPLNSTHLLGLNYASPGTRPLALLLFDKWWASDDSLAHQVQLCRPHVTSMAHISITAAACCNSNSEIHHTGTCEDQLTSQLNLRCWRFCCQHTI